MASTVTGVRVWLFDDRTSMRRAVGVRFGAGGPGDPPPEPAAPGRKASDFGESFCSDDEVCAFDVPLEPGFGVYLCAQQGVDLDCLVSLGRFDQGWEADAAAVAAASLASCRDWAAETEADGALAFPADQFALACLRLRRVLPPPAENAAALSPATSAAASAVQQLARDPRWAGALDSADGAVVLVLSPSQGVGWGAFVEDWLRRPPHHP